jgi:murein DD-endopeptidase MepM/ murein hydrolase activator NlpD
LLAVAFAAAALPALQHSASADGPPTGGDYFLRPQPSTLTEHAKAPKRSAARAAGSLVDAPAFGVLPLSYRQLEDEDPVQPAPPAQPFRIHTVRDGDTSFTIAVKYGITVYTLLVNNPHIEPGEPLEPGLQVVVPLDDGVLHTVQQSETLASIAALYVNGSAQAITAFAANHIRADSDLVPGARLLVPGAEPPPPPPPAAPVPEGTPVPDFAVPGLVWPVYGPISDEFASCRSEDCSVWHTGLDIDLYDVAGTHTEVYAAAAGTVVHVEHLTYSYGYHVIIDNGYGMNTLYGHLSEIWVSPGQQLQQNEPIGLSGSTGYSTGEHLHFEVRIDGQFHDPLAYLP